MTLTFVERAALVAWTRRKSRKHVAEQICVTVSTLDALIMGADSTRFATIRRVRPFLERNGIYTGGVVVMGGLH